MSHKIFKQLALASLAGMMVTTSAFAGEDTEVKIGGKLRAYVGQYDNTKINSATGSKDKAHLVEFGEANLGTKIKQGPLSAYFELEARNQTTLYAIQRRADVHFDDFKISFGTIKPKESYAFADDAESGLKTSDSHAYGFYKGELIKTEAQGLRFEYKMDGIKAGVTLYTVDPMNKTSFHQVSSAATTASLSDAKIAEYKAGSATQFGAVGKMDSLEFHISSLSAKTDDHSSTFKVLNHSGSQVGVRYKVMPDMKISVDTGAKKITQSNGTDTKKTSDTALQVQYKLGDDTLVFTLANDKYVDSTASSKGHKNSYTTLIFKKALDKHASLNAAYSTNTKSYSDTTKKDETKTFIGAGLYVKF